MTPGEVAKVFVSENPLASREQALEFGKLYFTSRELTSFFETWQRVHNHSAVARRTGFIDLDKAFQG